MTKSTNQQIILSILERKPETKAEFDNARTKVCAQMKTTQPPNRELFTSYKELVRAKKITENKIFADFLKKSNVRSLSGIAIVTSLTKPFPCPGKCVYCPNEARMPKSYIATEPAAARALRLKFSPYEQMKQRILILESNGHPTDKIEYIIKGGTWNSYPLSYQYWFILESFRAANTADRKKDSSAPSSVGSVGRNDKLLDASSSIVGLQTALADEQKKNETSKHRIIGLTLETRPDFITPESIFHTRKMGCTRIELGLQAPDDKILALIKRGHTVQQFKDAMFLLRTAGFKVDLHFMPDLPGSNAEHDVQMYKSLFSDPGLKPDMVKIYPNTVIKNTELHEWFTAGKFEPYSEHKLFEALIQMKLATPRYCRISRLIRDIPANEISAGNIITNLRENLQNELVARGKHCKCLHCREISRQTNTEGQKYLQNVEPKLFIDEYETTGGREYFISFEDEMRIAVFGFVRLRLPAVIARSSQATKQSCDDSNQQQANTQTASVVTLPCNDNLYSLLPEIKNTAFIRELHVYGQLVSIGKKDKAASQHKGLGRKLLQAAEKLAHEIGFKKIAIISGVGVREYYRKLGYRKNGTYMIKYIK